MPHKKIQKRHELRRDKILMCKCSYWSSSKWTELPWGDAWTLAATVMTWRWAVNCSMYVFSCWQWKPTVEKHIIKVKVKEVDLYSAFIVVPYTQGAQVRITQCYLQITPYLPLPRKHSPDGASPDWGWGHLIAVYYSFIYPERMKGWVSLVGWPTADGLPT